MPDANGPDGRWMDLADAVTLLREQIAEAQDRINRPPGTDGATGGDAAHKGVLFTVEEVTLQLGLELTSTKAVDGGLRWSVISLGGKKENSGKSTHTITMRLTPHGPDGRRSEVRDVE
ncbi:hypothetical protein KQY30_13200 [Streptomyces sp. GMY02]|uniref:trypco2 family protein n=1 Tax=Streptomyces sp. GMY02 TaxID=1333528 RepID=UPI001C2C1975|nr:trypco2 family protein [Streptomyces sp. GMY02]QXE35086.1 hypothetical protein KQY30_13200 [Streptomyces sp. GMY02]